MITVKVGVKDSVAHLEILATSLGSNTRPAPWYAIDESKYLSVITTSPLCSAGLIKEKTWWALSAAYIKASARGDITPVLLSNKISRS
jgi:hypothetical protein